MNLNLSRLVAPVAVLVLFGVAFYCLGLRLQAMQDTARAQGYATAQAEGKAALELQQRKYAEAEARRAQQAAADAKASAKREAEQAARADRLTADLAEQKRQYRNTTDRLSGEIARVNDLYRDALDAPPKPVPACVLTRGWVRIYDEATGARVPTAADSAGATAPATAGDPAEQLPSGIDQRAVLAHHVRYAEQCQGTAAQLDALINVLEGH
ncbi:hypothetical protein I5I61_26570 [Pseudomonas nitroreducens]|uniref:DNA-packaging protein n=1 Tax=Pseudomonas nitroreducens TaxID=46680 RepID=A0ABS0KSR0_PSENT|nr:hypothetical protein [Pseudomonas nitroreducens]MBG6291036.1 hypothetical protein [Pseudomonas nitroreducens]